MKLSQLFAPPPAVQVDYWLTKIHSGYKFEIPRVVTLVAVHVQRPVPLLGGQYNNAVYEG